MNRAIQAFMLAIFLAAFAWAQDVPAPPAPPQTPTTPATPRAARAPRAPKTPKTSVGPEAHGSYLGIDSRDVTPERAGELKLPSDQGVEVVMVDQDAPAGKAGLKEHDVIVKFNGKPVTDPYELRTFIRDTAPNTVVNLGLYRDGKPMDVKVKLAGRPVFMGGPIHIPKITIPPMPEIDVPSFAMLQYSRRNGLMVEPLTRQLGEFFGAKEGHGVLVRSVEKNSPAEMAGFRAGDVIVRVGDEPIENINDWNQVMRQKQSGKIGVTVIRDKREQIFTLALPERRSEGSAVYFPGMDLDMHELQVQIADIGPQIEKAMAEARKEWEQTRNSPEFRRQMEEAQREARKAMEMNRAELRKQVEEARREAEKARKEWERERQQWQKEMQQDNEE